MRNHSPLLAIGSLQGLGAIIGLFSNVYLARVIGPDEKGLVDYYALIVFLSAEVASFGWPSGLLYVLARDRELAGAIHLNSFLLAIVLGSGAAVVAQVIGRLFLPQVYVTALFIGSISIPIALYRTLFGSIATALNQAALAQALQVVALTVPTLGYLLLGWAGKLDATTAMISLAAGSYLTAGVSAVSLRRCGLRWEFGALREAWPHSWRIFPGHLVNIATFRADQFVVGTWAGPSALGVYALAARLAEAFWMLDQAIILSYLHRIATLPRRASWRLTNQLMLVIGSAGLAAVAISIIFGRGVIGAVFGASFSGTSDVFSVLLVASVLWSCGRVVAQHLAYNLGKFSECTTGAIAGAALSAAGLLMIAGRDGLVNLPLVAAVSVFSYAIVALIYWMVGWQSSRVTEQQ